MSKVMEEYEKRIKAMKESLVDSDIMDELAIKQISNNNLNEVIQKMFDITSPLKVWNEFAFRTGKLMGLCRTIAQSNEPNRSKLLAATGVTEEEIEMYKDVCGNLPFHRKKSNTVDTGKDMDIPRCKEFIKHLGLKFGYLVTDADLSDINEERWKMLYTNRLQDAIATMNSGAVVKEAESVTYDE